MFLLTEAVDELSIGVGMERGVIDLIAFSTVVEQSRKILRVLDRDTLIWGLARAETHSPLQMRYVAKPVAEVYQYQTGVGLAYLELFRQLEVGSGMLPPSIQRAIPHADKMLRVLIRRSVKVTFSSPAQNRSRRLDAPERISMPGAR